MIVVRVTYSLLTTTESDTPVGAILVMESDDEKPPQVDAPDE
jgi:hypothetical protein